MIKQIKTAVMLLIIFTLLTGVIYPALVTGVAQLFFPWQANGSLIKQNGIVRGSLLIGQFFTAPQYLWSRPSATTPFPYNAANSSGSNWGPSNTDFLTAVKNRVAALQQSNPHSASPIPIDLVTASASGLDPDISKAAALYQLPRIAAARHVPEQNIATLIERVTQHRTLGLWGELRINVLTFNLILDQLYPYHD